MKDILLDENGTIIKPTDYKAKCEDIKNKLYEKLFSNIRQDDIYDIKYDNFGNEIKKKKTNKKNEIKPFLSVLQVNSVLNELLRVYKPITYSEALTKSDNEYLEALKYYMELISYINNYVGLVPSKQSFSAFANITTSIYNDLMVEPSFSSVFSSIEDYLVDFNFTAGVSSLVDAKMIQSRLQTKEAGHSLARAEQNITLIQNNTLDRQAIYDKLSQFENMVNKKLPSSKK